MTITNVTAAQADAGLLTPNAVWTGNAITYSIPGAGASWSSTYATSGKAEPTDAHYGVLNATQAANIRLVMSAWDSLIAPTITEVSDTAPGQIRVAFTDVQARENPSTYAYAYSPPIGSATPVSGDVWIDYRHAGASFAANTSDYQVLLHEVGHSLGLKHPFEGTTLPAAYENKTYSLMSYTGQDYFYTFSGGNGSIAVSYEPTLDFTPMVLDVKAVQDRYGADPNTRAGNTTYAYTDGMLNGRQTIYDAGGQDTIDLSALSRGSSVDLRPGAYSSLDAYSVDQQIADLDARYGAGFDGFFRTQLTNSSRPAFTWQNNLGISFSSQIENVIGSSRADTIVGNTLANVITGGGGADVFTGGGGADIYRDTAANLNGDRITDFTNASVIHVTNASGPLVGLSFSGSSLSFALASAPGTVTTMAIASAGLTGTVQQRADAAGGVDIFFGSAPAPTGDTTPPQVAFTVASQGGSAPGHFTFSGTASDANLSAVRVYDHGSLIGNAVLDTAHGTWSLGIDLGAGTHYDFTAVAVDAAGNQRSAAFAPPAGQPSVAYTTGITGQPFTALTNYTDASGHVVTSVYIRPDGHPYQTVAYGYAADGHLAFTNTTNPDGTTTSVVPVAGNPNYASVYTLVDASGHTLAQTYSRANSSPYETTNVIGSTIVKQHYETNGSLGYTQIDRPDGTHEITSFNITGQSYVSSDIVYDQAFRPLVSQYDRANGSHEIVAGQAGQHLIATGAPDTLVGFAGGPDTFVFNKSFGGDRIGNFEPTRDIVQLTGVTNASGLAAALSGGHDVGGAAVLDFGNHDTLTFDGVSVAQLQANSNHFFLS